MTRATLPTRQILEAAEVLDAATALVITAGAGVGVDSGLPDFRGPEGFWRAYPPYRALGLDFAALADPRWFKSDPEFAWGFYGHRLRLYRATKPHAGFAILRRWAQGMRDAAFIFTSNVDGQFQRAGFPADRIVECHGAIDHLQCVRRCGVGIFPADGVEVEVDPTTFRAAPPLPSCPRCGGLARPNILMFGDAAWDDRRTEGQEASFARWLDGVQREHLVVVECGAGTSIPTVRCESESLVSDGGTLIRINQREADIPPDHIGLPLGALEALEAIDRARGPR